MIETIERTRSGYSIAIVWTIIPPIEAPTRWADSIPRWSISPIVSRAMSRSRYGAVARRPDIMSTRLETPADSILVERPMSRLSKRMTRKPRSTSIEQSSGGQAIICVASPITMISGSPSVGPISW